MKYLEFTENEKTFFILIDNQHKEFIQLVNKLYNTTLKNNKTETNNLILELIKYLQYHFETEEKLMRETKFEGYYSHKLEHDRYLRKINKIYTDLNKNNTLPNLEFFESIKNWFTNHLEINDKKMAAYFVKLGIK